MGNKKSSLSYRIESVKRFFSSYKELPEEYIEQVITYSQRFLKPFYIYYPQNTLLCSTCGICGNVKMKKDDSLLGTEICRINKKELVQIETEHLATCLEILGYIKNFERIHLSTYSLNCFNGAKCYLYQDFIYFPPRRCPISHSFKYTTSKLKKEEKSWLK